MKVHQYVLNIQKDTDLSMTDLADINSNIKILHTPSNVGLYIILRHQQHIEKRL